jgi:hypothetical protein
VDDVGRFRRWSGDHVPGRSESWQVVEIVVVVVGQEPDRAACRERGIPLRVGDERAVDELDQLVAGEAPHLVQRVRLTPLRMSNRHEVRSFPQEIDDQLLLVERLPERKVEPEHPPRADRELMALPEVVSMLVERNGPGAGRGRNVLIVGDARHGVAGAPIRLGHFGRRLLPGGESPPRPAVCMQVGSLPGAGQIAVWVVERRARKGRRLRELVERGPCVRSQGQDDGNDQRTFHVEAPIVPRFQSVNRCEGRGDRHRIGATAR